MVAGFDLAMGQGPLCDEPMQGVGIIIEELSTVPTDTEENGSAPLSEDRLQDAQLQGQLISAMKQSCRVALKKHPLRLVAAMYMCRVFTSSQALGKVHAVLAQKHAKVRLFQTSHDLALPSV